jgi:hypothetical protein
MDNHEYFSPRNKQIRELAIHNNNPQIKPVLARNQEGIFLESGSRQSRPIRWREV